MDLQSKLFAFPTVKTDSKTIASFGD